MTHYVCIGAGDADVLTNYPHTPNDYAQSLQEYLEDQLAAGLRFVGAFIGDTVFVFEVVAK